MTLRIVRLGEPRDPQEGTRIGTVRRPPRGVRKERYAPDDWFDVWYPDLAPSAELMAQGQAAVTETEGNASSAPSKRRWMCRRRDGRSICWRRSRMAPTYRSAATAKTRPAATGLCFANY